MMTKTNKNTNKRDRKEGEAWSEEEGRAEMSQKNVVKKWSPEQVNKLLNKHVGEICVFV